MQKDLFFVTKILDSELHGSNSKMGMLYEMMGLFGEWSFDLAAIKCPTFIYNGMNEEVPLPHAKMLNKLIPNSWCLFQEQGLANRSRVYVPRSCALLNQKKASYHPIFLGKCKLTLVDFKL